MTSPAVGQRSGSASGPAALVAFTALVFLVGTNIIAIRASNRELPPFWNAGLRFALAACVFGAIGVAQGVTLPTRRAVGEATVYGVLAFGAFFGFLYAGLVHVPAGLGQVVLALGPLLTLAMAVAVGMEPFRLRPVGGGLVALTGIAVMYGVDGGASVPLSSLFAIGLAAAAFAAGGIVVKRGAPANPIVRNTIATAVGAGVLLGLSALAGERWALPGDPATALSLAYLVLPGTVGVFLLFLFLLREWTATAVSTQFVLAPIVGISLGGILLDEPVGPTTVLGALLVIGGVWLGGIRGSG